MKVSLSGHMLGLAHFMLMSCSSSSFGGHGGGHGNPGTAATAHLPLIICPRCKKIRVETKIILQEETGTTKCVSTSVPTTRAFCNAAGSNGKKQTKASSTRTKIHISLRGACKVIRSCTIVLPSRNTQFSLTHQFLKHRKSISQWRVELRPEPEGRPTRAHNQLLAGPSSSSTCTRTVLGATAPVYS